MPTYDYECRACGHVFETMHAMSAPALRKCPKCAKLKLVRLISGGAGVIFKGGGFYETDYKRKRGDGDPSKNPRDSSGGESSKPETKSESKPESKSETKSTDAKPEADHPKKD